MGMSSRLWRTRQRDYAATIPVYRYTEDSRGRVVARHHIGWSDITGDGRALAFRPCKETTRD
jgi:hypothetical protein